MENDQTRATITTAAATTGKEADHDDCHDLLIASLPKEKGWSSHQLYLYQGFWCPSVYIREEMAAQHFQARQKDIVLAINPKSGTTWLKALAFSILHRQHYTPSQNSPLLTSNPHALVPNLFLFQGFVDQDLNSNNAHSTRLLATHLPYHALPPSIKSLAIGCRIVYLCRNPYDTFISAWHFFTKASDSLEPLSLNDAFDMYCRGIFGYGPFWDHMLGYWKESSERPQKVLFLKYEDLKDNPILHMKRLAEFMGVPFSIEEENEGLIEEISRLCSINNLRELDVNKTGKFFPHFENKAFFRKGEVGDWVNYLTPEMVARLDKVIQEKMVGFGLTFKTSL
ncbi:sulfotransferase 2B [Actinidia rufa]|uniref:Sulfotransferase n=1 Tax=Actinidia rufa TaxID=165716 RepID=A0A7J0DG18_9ERIC|nr:sulfotransferase 2B [Actinidia rufa]